MTTPKRPPEPAGEVPAPAYQPTLLDRMGPDGAAVLRVRFITAIVFVVSFMILLGAAGLNPATAAHPLLTGLIGASLSAWFAHFMLVGLPGGAADLAQAVTMPTGNSTPYQQQYSLVESAVARGDIAGALASYEQILADDPLTVLPRARAAELYAGRGENPARAAALFREIRALEGVSTSDALYASSRLVDLYDGVLNDPGRALVEMRRIIELYPGTAVATHARQALPRMKARIAASNG